MGWYSGCLSTNTLLPANSSSKVALITGGGRGIGAACVDRFLREGWRVATVALPGENVERWTAPSVLAMSGDITSAEVATNLVERTLQRFGRIDALVNNAGVGLYALPSEIEIDLFSRLLSVNVIALLRLTQLIIPTMRRQGAGTIVNIGSVAGNVALPWAAAYCASKYAVHCITDSLRRELRRDGIRVMKICPGIVSTDFRQHVLQGAAPPSVASLRFVVSAESVAAAVLKGVESGSSRTVYVPSIGRIFSALGFFPQLMDLYLNRFAPPPVPPFASVAPVVSSEIESESV